MERRKVRIEGREMVGEDRRTDCRISPEGGVVERRGGDGDTKEFVRMLNWGRRKEVDDVKKSERSIKVSFNMLK